MKNKKTLLAVLAGALIVVIGAVALTSSNGSDLQGRTSIEYTKLRSLTDCTDTWTEVNGLSSQISNFDSGSPSSVEKLAQMVDQGCDVKVQLSAVNNNGASFTCDDVSITRFPGRNETQINCKSNTKLSLGLAPRNHPFLYDEVIFLKTGNTRSIFLYTVLEGPSLGTTLAESITHTVIDRDVKVFVRK